MPGIDRLISKTVSKKLKNAVGENILKKIERQIFHESGLSIKLAIENFHIINDALKQNQIKKINTKQIFNKIIAIKRNNNTDFQVKIKDTDLTMKIFKMISDFESFLIIKALMNNVYTTEDIIQITGIPKTSAYRKIQKMILEGFLIIDSREKTKTRFSTKISCLFKEILVVINQNQIEITLVISEKIFKKSSISEFI